MKKKYASIFFLILSDSIVILLSFLIAYFIRNNILPSISPNFNKTILLPFSQFLKYFYMSVVWIIVFAYEKLYVKRYSFWDEIRVLLKSATICSSLITILIFISRNQLRFSRTVVILAWIISLFLFPLMRLLTKYLLVKINIWKTNIVVIGVNETALTTIQNITSNYTTGFEIEGIIDDNPKKLRTKFNNYEILGSISELETILRNCDAKNVIIAVPDISKKKLNDILEKCEKQSVSIWIVPKTGDIITTGVEIETLDKILTLRIKNNLAKPINIFLKTISEKIITLILLLLLSPIYVLISISIKID